MKTITTLGGLYTKVDELKKKAPHSIGGDGCECLFDDNDSIICECKCDKDNKIVAVRDATMKTISLDSFTHLADMCRRGVRLEGVMDEKGKPVADPDKKEEEKKSVPNQRQTTKKPNS